MYMCQLELECAAMERPRLAAVRLWGPDVNWVPQWAHDGNCRVRVAVWVHRSLREQILGIRRLNRHCIEGSMGE